MSQIARLMKSKDKNENLRYRLTKLYKKLIYPDQIRLFNQLLELDELDNQRKAKHQVEKLRKILDLAKRQIPYYHNSISDLAAFEYSEFQKIPFLTKSNIRSHAQELCNPCYVNTSGIFTNSSGGSTGEPVIFFQTKKQYNFGRASYHYANYLNGISPYDNTVILWGALRDMKNSGRRSVTRRIKDFLSHSVMLNTFVMSEDVILRYIQKMNQIKPRFIKAYVHSIFEIAKYINKKGITIKFTPVIQTTTGPLYAEMKSEIESAFNGARIFNFYGSREVSAIASQTKSSSDMVVMFDNVFVEIVDDKGIPVKNGEEGEIVITTLNNEYMPLIRYKIGDRGVKGDDNEFGCLVLKSVLGRTLGVIHRRDGSHIDGQFFTSLFFSVPGIEKFQLVQRSMTSLDLKIIKGNSFDPANLDNIVAQIKTNLDGVDVNVIFTDDINHASSGKIMYVYSELRR